MPFAGSLRISLSLSPGRVPRGPSELTAASRSSVTYATVMLSLWTATPMKSVLPCAMAALLLWVNNDAVIRRLWPRNG